MIYFFVALIGRSDASTVSHATVRLVTMKCASLLVAFALILFMEYVVILKLHNHFQDSHQQQDRQKEELAKVEQVLFAGFSSNQDGELGSRVERADLWQKKKFLLKYYAKAASDSDSKVLIPKEVHPHRRVSANSEAAHSVATQLTDYVKSVNVTDTKESDLVAGKHVTDSVAAHSEKAADEHASLGEHLSMETASATLPVTLPNKERSEKELFLDEDNYEKLSLQRRHHITDVLTRKLKRLQSLDLNADNHPRQDRWGDVGGLDDFFSKLLNGEIEESYSSSEAEDNEPLVEKYSLESRKLTPFEEAGNNILFTLRTTQKEHNKRLPLLMETWISKVNRSNIFLVTDGSDSVWQEKTGNAGMITLLYSFCVLFCIFHSLFFIVIIVFFFLKGCTIFFQIAVRDSILQGLFC